MAMDVPGAGQGWEMRPARHARRAHWEVFKFSLSKLGDISVGNRYGVTIFNITEFIFLSRDIEYLTAVSLEGIPMVSASA